jgi:hypothetical protein
MTNTQLPDRFTVSVKGETTEIFMSYALLNRLAAFVSVQEGDVASSLINPMVQDGMLRHTFAKTVFKGQKIEDVDIEDLELNVADATALIEWEALHIADFLAKGVERTAALATRSQAALGRAQKMVDELAKSSTPSSPGTAP